MTSVAPTSICFASAALLRDGRKEEPMVKGIAEMNRAFAAIPKRVESAARKAMEQGAEELVAMMKRLAPVDDGDLRDSIGWSWGKAPAGAAVFAESTTPDERGLKLIVYAGNRKAFYAAFVEFGTEAHSTAKGGGTVVGKKAAAESGAKLHKGSRAQPFFFPAYRALRKRIQSRIRREMKKSIKIIGPTTQAESE
jgi:HK97 gp10 family phage protein